MCHKERLSRFSAMLLVLTAHVAMLYWLLSVGRHAPAATESRMQLRLLPAAPPSPATAPPRQDRPRPVARTPHASPTPAKPMLLPVITESAPAAMAASSPTADSPFQIDTASIGPGALPAFQHDLLRDRRTRLPGEGTETTMRMRRPPSTQQVLHAIGQLLTAGYEADPCPRIHRNVQELLAASSDTECERLGEELRRMRAYCP